MIYGLKMVMKYLLGTDQVNRNIRAYPAANTEGLDWRSPQDFQQLASFMEEIRN